MKVCSINEEQRWTSLYLDEDPVLRKQKMLANKIRWMPSWI